MADTSALPAGLLWRATWPTNSEEVLSRERSASLASLTFATIDPDQSTGTGAAFPVSTRVTNPLLDWRANSTLRLGPSECHTRSHGNLPGFQVREPQPRKAIR